MKYMAFITLSLFASLEVFAATGQPSEAQALIQSTEEKVTARIGVERDQLREDRPRLYKIVNELVIPHFDFPRISRWVLGKYWRQADEAQRAQFMDGFQKLLIRTYATVLLEFSDQNIDYLSVNADPDDPRLVTVRSVIHQAAGGPPVPVNYRMHFNDQQWKVYDISMDGVSLLATYRNTFGADVRNYGLDGVISRLAAKGAEVAE